MRDVTDFPYSVVGESVDDALSSAVMVIGQASRLEAEVRTLLVALDGLDDPDPLRPARSLLSRVLSANTLAVGIARQLQERVEDIPEGQRP